jgi:cell division GTPase FtsZ
MCYMPCLADCQSQLTAASACNVNGGGHAALAQVHTLQLEAFCRCHFFLCTDALLVSLCRAREAAMQATSSPLLEVGIEQATGIVWNITGPEDMTLYEVGVTTIRCR